MAGLLSTVFHWLLVLTPALVANMAPILVKPLWPQFNQPIDCGLRLRNRPLLGANKTWRGLLAGMLLGGIASWLISLATTAQPAGFWFGVLAGFWALLGDMVGSALKRQLDIPSGGHLPILDEADYIVGFLLVTALITSWSLGFVLFAIVLVLLANPLVNRLGYHLGLKEHPW
ncbi:MAG: CDP-archaeol synthase [Alphaproteobacteria bacterium]|jgi:CDP-2,3-bis-(O-geranylgeranyl)-sn-glycerol synthase|nr:CDP-archaeol synthase [Alphaproteobacteria bacterium]